MRIQKSQVKNTRKPICETHFTTVRLRQNGGFACSAYDGRSSTGATTPPASLCQSSDRGQ